VKDAKLLSSVSASAAAIREERRYIEGKSYGNSLTGYSQSVSKIKPSKAEDDGSTSWQETEI
jgi:hypothetical protein